jgi:hypothetical protein
MHDDKPLVQRKPSVCKQLQVGKTLLDQMIAAGDLEVVQLGPRAVGITTESLNRVAREGALKLAALKRDGAPTGASKSGQ